MAQDEGLAANGLRINAFDDIDGAEFFLSFLGRPDSIIHEDRDAANALTKRFSGWPFGLRVAAAYIRRKNINAARFLRLYDEKPRDILEFSTTGTSLSSLSQLVLNGITHDTAELLDGLSFLGPSEVPVELFDNVAFHFLDASEWLWSRSLIEYDRSKKFFCVDPHTHGVWFDKIMENRERYDMVFGKVLDYLLDAVPEPDLLQPRDPELWKLRDMYVSHVVFLEKRSRMRLPPASASRLLILIIRCIQ